tara:strand:+ start:4892 stop:5578 length:687 start_codon:yes stop_codon:yes gene_type:complete
MNYKQVAAKDIPHIHFNDVKKTDDLMEKKYNINPIQLMELAGFQVANIISSMNKNKNILVLCGKGNNGGDGLVAARHLYTKGHNVDVCIAYEEKYYKDLAGKQLTTLKKYPISILKNFPKEKNYDLVIDALLGSGTKSDLKSPIKDFVLQLNKYKSSIVSIDVPTGINTPLSLNANITITFDLPKKIFLKNHEQCGTILLVDIGAFHNNNKDKNLNLFKKYSILKLDY